jgi:hypothetical protein
MTKQYQCGCEVPSCGKCLSIGCTNDNCQWHSIKDKILWRKRSLKSIKNSEEAEKVLAEIDRLKLVSNKNIGINPKICPKCQSVEVLKIEYGHPGIDIDSRPDLYFAGCCVEDYEWICKKCHWEWGKKGDGKYCEDNFDD